MTILTIFYKVSLRLLIDRVIFTQLITTRKSQFSVFK